MYEEDKEFLSLVGKEHDFFGVDNECFKLGDHVLEALEDGDDGYRSYLGSIMIHDNLRNAELIFHKRAFARVRLEEHDDGYFSGYRLVDVDDGHEWMRFGTENYNDYYPMFSFHYQAKKS